VYRVLNRGAIVACAMLLGAAAAAAPFSAGSADVPAGSTIADKFVFNGFGCKGGNVSPAVSWANPPAGTKSFALLVHDPDAPTGGAGWWHWLVVDIPAATTGLPQGAGATSGGALPAGARQITTDFGSAGWGGPCPPPGDKPHHYNFTVYALKVDKLDLPANPSAALAGYMVNGNALGKASFTALYGR